MSKVLEALLPKVAQDGWAAGFGSLPNIRWEAMRLGWTEVANRRGEPPVTTLRPLDRGDAHPNSLSSRYGKGEQPLHTDGAHLLKPPDFLILACDTPSNTPTRICRPKRGRFTTPPDYVWHGVFLVQNGKDSFYSTAYSDGTYRYDPGCMEPCDARARKAARFFGDADPVVEHAWDRPGMILVIDNRRALHARASATDEPERIIQRVSFYVKAESA
jgi:hypothetical protein